MDIDPLESARDADEKAEPRDRVAARLNTSVAITMALLATFLGVCKVIRNRAWTRDRAAGDIFERADVDRRFPFIE